MSVMVFVLVSCSSTQPPIQSRAVLRAIHQPNVNGMAVIVGQVRDEKTDERLVGANVVLVGTKKGATTDSTGNYAIHNVSSGSYSLKAVSIGCKPARLDNIEIHSGDILIVDFQMADTTVHLDVDVWY
jgi:hypothetical protein